MMTTVADSATATSSGADQNGSPSSSTPQIQSSPSRSNNLAPNLSRDGSPPIAPELTSVITLAVAPPTNVDQDGRPGGGASDSSRQLAGLKRRASGSPIPRPYQNEPTISSISIPSLNPTTRSSPVVTMPSASIMATAAAATAAAAVAAAATAIASTRNSSHTTSNHHNPSVPQSHHQTSSTLISGLTASAPPAQMTPVSLTPTLQSVPVLAGVNDLGIGAGSPNGPINMSVMTPVSSSGGGLGNTTPKARGPARDFSHSVRKKLHSSNRTGQACDRCKVRKIKCDGMAGGCSPCQQNHTTCRTTDRITGRATTRGYSDRLEMDNQALRARLSEREQQLRELGHDCHSADLLTPPPPTAPLAISMGVGLETSPSGNSPQTSPPDLQSASAFQHHIFQAPDMWSSSTSSGLLSVSAYNNAMNANGDSKRVGGGGSGNGVGPGSVANDYGLNAQPGQHPQGEQSEQPVLATTSPSQHHQHNGGRAHQQQHIRASSQAEPSADGNGSQPHKLKGLPFFGQAFDVPGIGLIGSEPDSENQRPSDMMNTS